MKTRILLVEDDERLAKLTAEYLCKNDFAVDIEPRGNTAEARILAERPDGRLRGLPRRALAVRRGDPDAHRT